MKLVRITCCLFVLLLTLVVFSFAAARPAAAQQTLNPPPPSDYTCKTVGNGTICRADRAITFGPSDNGIVCGSGSSAFDVYDSEVYDLNLTRIYDQNGNLTRRDVHQKNSFGQFSNPLTGRAVPYTEHNVYTDILAVPGDLNTVTETTTGEVIVRPPQGAPVYVDVGKTVFNFFDGTLEFQAGHNDSNAYYYFGDSSVVQKLCAALS
jgi:hypothetical protein